MVLGPSGEVISDTLCETEGLLYQDIDIAQCVEPKQFHDVVGYYNRFDVFDLKVTRTRLKAIEFDDASVAPIPTIAGGGDGRARHLETPAMASQLT